MTRALRLYCHRPVRVQYPGSRRFSIILSMDHMIQILLVAAMPRSMSLFRYHHNPLVVPQESKASYPLRRPHNDAMFPTS